MTSAEASRRQALIDGGDRRLRPDEGSAYLPNGGLHHVSGTLSVIYVLSRRWAILRPGGILLADNVLASGEVARGTGETAFAIRAFLDAVAATTSLRSVIVPLGDGCLFGVKQ